MNLNGTLGRKLQELFLIFTKNMNYVKITMDLFSKPIL